MAAPHSPMTRAGRPTSSLWGLRATTLSTCRPLANGDIQVTENGIYENFDAIGLEIFNVAIFLDGEYGSVNGGNDSVSIDATLSSKIAVGVAGGSGTNVFTARDPSGREFGGQIEFDGGTGNNTLIGGAGSSFLQVKGARGSHSLLEGGTGDVTEQDDGSGDDTLIGGSGDSYLGGGAGNDTLIAGTGYSKLIGNYLNVTVAGGGNNILRGPTNPAE